MKNIEILYVNWRDEKKSKTYTVGFIDQYDIFQFRYGFDVDKAIENGFELIEGFKDINKIYKSEHLFEYFNIKIPNKENNLYALLDLNKGFNDNLSFSSSYLKRLDVENDLQISDIFLKCPDCKSKILLGDDIQSLFLDEDEEAFFDVDTGIPFYILKCSNKKCETELMLDIFKKK